MDGIAPPHNRYIPHIRTFASDHAVYFDSARNGADFDARDTMISRIMSHRSVHLALCAVCLGLESPVIVRAQTPPSAYVVPRLSPYGAIAPFAQETPALPPPPAMPPVPS